jgi:type II secretory pathway pseudopilin PulG
MLKRLLSLERGDTIVEVLVSLAILSSALAISYATASRSLLQTRQAQEHSEALKIAENQMENLRQLAGSTDPTKDIFITGNGFCIDSTAAVIQFKPPATGTTFTPPASASADNTARYPAQCKSGFYYFGVAYNAATGVFTVSVRWDGVTKQGLDQVQLTYKLFKFS